MPREGRLQRDLSQGSLAQAFELRQGGLERTSLFLRHSQQWRTAAEDRIVDSRYLRAGVGDDAAKPWVHEERHAKDRRSLNRLIKNGRTEAGLSGPPKLNKTTSRRSFSYSEKWQPPTSRQASRVIRVSSTLGWRFRHDAMPKIEDERPPPPCVQHTARRHRSIEDQSSMLSDGRSPLR
jgi:hypothetical protein